ncbi:hypothetical protein [Luethyella okanaganae]|uniref:Uncharacterized protein n=1 Tax=Luethyella okanaganae TaxID=69372 RepID=A0ABW1VAW4_9MICO
MTGHVNRGLANAERRAVDDEGAALRAIAHVWDDAAADVAAVLDRLDSRAAPVARTVTSSVGILVAVGIAFLLAAVAPILLIPEVLKRADALEGAIVAAGALLVASSLVLLATELARRRARDIDADFRTVTWFCFGLALAAIVLTLLRSSAQPVDPGLGAVGLGAQLLGAVLLASVAVLAVVQQRVLGREHAEHTASALVTAAADRDRRVELVARRAVGRLGRALGAVDSAALARARRAIGVSDEASWAFGRAALDEALDPAGDTVRALRARQPALRTPRKEQR